MKTFSTEFVANFFGLCWDLLWRVKHTGPNPFTRQDAIVLGLTGMARAL